MQPSKILITDIDNTLTNFVDYFSPCFRAMVHAIHSQTGIDEDEIIRSYVQVYQCHGTIEYTFATQELDCLNRLPSSKRKEMVDLAKKAFGQAHKHRLKAYSDIPDFLDMLKACGWTIYAVTNAPVYKAYLRLQRVGIKNFSGISAWEGKDTEALDPEDNLELKSKKLRAFDRLDKLGIKLLTYKSNLIKPNRIMFEHVVEHAESIYGKNIELWSLGDNVLNDLSPCHSLGIKTVWAKYGANISEKELDTMMQITPWQRTHRQKNETAVKQTTWDFTAETTKDLFTIFDLPQIPQQVSLFD